jgi:hypothetical protein
LAEAVLRTVLSVLRADAVAARAARVLVLPKVLRVSLEAAVTERVEAVPADAADAIVLRAVPAEALPREDAAGALVRSWRTLVAADTPRASARAVKRVSG